MSYKNTWTKGTSRRLVDRGDNSRKVVMQSNPPDSLVSRIPIVVACWSTSISVNRLLSVSNKLRHHLQSISSRFLGSQASLWLASSLIAIKLEVYLWRLF